MKLLNREDASTLRDVFQRESEKSDELRFMKRVQSLLLISEGFSCNKVARWTGSNARTVQLWVARYAERGIEGLRERAKGSPTRKLDEHELRRIRSDLEKHPSSFGLSGESWNGPLLREHLAADFAVDLSLRQCQRLLRVCRQDLRLSSRHDRPPGPARGDTAW